ncbi:hypothetical protein PITCH_A840079 [uncultured Desulfobacterium sp.]|uniref:Uncharacterized protein n=1 Tax=uncultured Desulfobacterium sp. TaxID=201089 RepID=A0A445N3C8_9BACT|nr:hypothetical protein PITCH_A840079 [uncultured Desulfobacterium sp.]
MIEHPGDETVGGITYPGNDKNEEGRQKIIIYQIDNEDWREYNPEDRDQIRDCHM